MVGGKKKLSCSQKLLCWYKANLGDHHYAEASKKLGMKADTARRVLNRLAEKGLISRVYAPTMIADKDKLPVKGPSKPLRGFFRYDSDTKAHLESVPNFTRIDRFVSTSVLKLHRVGIVAEAEGLYDGMIDKGHLTFVERKNLSCHVGRSRVLDYLVEVYANSAFYRAHCDAFPFSGLDLRFRDFVDYLEWASVAKVRDMYVSSLEATVDLPMPSSVDASLGYVKIYLKQMLGKDYLRCEVFLSGLKLRSGSGIDVEKVLMEKSLSYLVSVDETRNYLRSKLGLPNQQTISHVGEFRGDLRPKYGRWYG
jgi:hypothetical protein